MNILEKDPGTGIADWRMLIERFQKLPHVIAVAPVLYDEVLVTGPIRGKYATLKGIDKQSELKASETLHHLKTGSLARLTDDDNGLPSLILGSKLALDTGATLNSVVTVISPQGTLTPFGPRIRSQRFRVAGTFESDFYEVDDSWAYADIRSMQKLLSSGDVVNSIELRLDDMYLAPQIAKEAATAGGAQYTAIPWEEANRDLLHALQAGTRGNGDYDGSDRTGGRVEYSDYADDDCAHEVQRHCGADVDGGAQEPDPPYLYPAGGDDRQRGHGYRAGAWLHAQLCCEPVSSGATE